MMDEVDIYDTLNEGVEETGSIEGALEYMMEECLRDLFPMGDWDDPESTEKIIEYQGKYYEIKIFADDCIESTDSHRIMGWRHEIKEVEKPVDETEVEGYWKKRFSSVIKELPHSKGRVPYTYHHDYLRKNHKSYKDSSRSEVAGLHCANKDELYATALVEICSGMSLIDCLDLDLTPQDFDVIRKAREITGEYFKKERPSIS